LISLNGGRYKGFVIYAIYVPTATIEIRQKKRFRSLLIVSKRSQELFFEIVNTPLQLTAIPRALKERR